MLDSMVSDQAVAPVLWWFEMRNLLLMRERRGHIEPATVEQLLHDLAALDIVMDDAREEVLALALARRHQLTFYDAAYLELAVRLGLPLVSLDRQLTSAAEIEGVEVIGTQP